MIIAFAMVLVMGIAAVVIDATGAGFNERRQDQTAADTSVMAGALGYIIGEDDLTKVSRALELARANLDTSYTNAEWRTAWENCTDPDIAAVDLGNGVSAEFTPMPNPFDGGATNLQCVSEGPSHLRVVIPKQVVETTFGKVLGFDSVSTHAEAVAIIETEANEDGLLPFGIPGNTSNGEACFSSNPSGPAEDPCQGPNGGGFGAINSELFGVFFGAPDCGNPGATELAQNIALGIDHFVDIWTEAATEGVSPGSTHPGDATVAGYEDISYDQCRYSGGVIEPQQAGQSFPPNTFRVDTGFSQAAAVEAGMISNQTWSGPNGTTGSRLQETTNSTQTIVKKQTGGSMVSYPVDDRGPWTYLTAGSGDCDPTSYTSAMTTAEKVEQFDDCLSGWGSGDGVIFDTSIEFSPRFGWAPQYWHAPSTSGSSWQPVMQYRVVFLGGLWFNCTAAADCGATFYPDQSAFDDPGNLPVCDAFAGGCKELNLDQLSAWVLPTDAVPSSITSAFPGSTDTPFRTGLYR